MVKQAEAEAAAAAAFAEPKAPKRSGKKLIFFVIMPLLFLLIGGGGAAYYFLLAPKPDEAEHEAPPPPPKTYVYYNLPEMLVNMSGSSRRASFLKMTVSLQLDSEADVVRVQKVMPRIVDSMQAYLRELRPDDLVGAAKLARVSRELLDRANAAVTPVKVADVLFLDILLQ